MRRLLAISSATAEASVAFMQEGAVVAEQTGSARRDHAETLLELIDAVLKDAGCAIEAVDAYAVTRGPGAFTSLRVGIGSVKGLSFRAGLPVAPVSTLAALALDAPVDREPGLPVAALLDAGRGEVYAALFDPDCKRPLPQWTAGVYDLEALETQLPGPLALVGSGAESHAGRLADCVGRVLYAGCVPRARHVARLGFAALGRGEGVDAADLRPDYLRGARAEVSRKAALARRSGLDTI